MDLFWNLIEQDSKVLLTEFLKENNVPKNIQDQFGYSPLHVALSNEKLSLIEPLVEYQFDLNSLDPKGQTPLHYCAFYNNLDVAELLLKNGASLAIQDAYGNEPLWTAVFNDFGRNERFEIISLFIACDADIQHKNNAGKSPIDIVRTRPYENLFELFGLSKI